MRVKNVMSNKYLSKFVIFFINKTKFKKKYYNKSQKEFFIMSVIILTHFKKYTNDFLCKMEENFLKR